MIPSRRARQKLVDKSLETALQRVQVRHQIGYLVDRELVLEARHFGAAHLNDVNYALVIGRNAAGHVRLLEESLQARPAQVARDVYVMALGTPCLVDTPAARLLCVESEFGVALSRLRLAAAERG